MRAVVYVEPGRAELREVHAPPAPGPGEVQVAIKAVGLDGTDISSFKGKGPVKFPLIAGHEATGVVVAVGSGVTSVAVGDRVLLNPLNSCGTCFYCHNNQAYICPNGGLMGREKDGACVERLNLPEQRVFKIPDDVDFGAGTVLQTLSTVVHAYQKARLAPGHRAVVLGAGVSGLMFAQVARAAGAGMVVSVARRARSLERARDVGADATVQQGPNLVEEVRRVLGGREADVVVESAGVPQTFVQALDLVRPGGVIIAFGTLSEPVPEYPAAKIYYRDVAILGSRASRPGDYVTAIDLYAQGRVRLGDVVTHRFPVEQAQQAFETATSSEALRVVLEFN